MADFDRAHSFTARWEGGLVDHPDDPGGITNYGVSLRWLKSLGIDDGDIDHDGDIDADDIRALTKEQAAGLFKARFWDAYQLGTFSQKLATAWYDAMVNTGPSQATKFMQRACNSVLGSGLSVDGIPGKQTRAALSSAGDMPALLTACLDERDRFYKNLAAGKASFKSFLKGWLNRTSALRKELGL